jgi:putative transposase
VKESGFHKMKNKPKIVTLALDLYFKGISYRKVVDHLKQFYGITVSHVAIIKWVKKYTKLMKEYVDSMIPQTGGIWHTDEMAINIKGQYNWLWNVMDHETRFLLASQISQRREIKDARDVFQQAKKVANGKPQVMVTDGLSSYIKAFKKEFYTLRNPRVKRIAKPRFVDKANNNMVERMQGSIREREKVMRALKKNEENPAIDGFRIYYNFIRPHQALDGKTPAETANLDLDLGENKWLSLIRQSAENREIPKVTTEKIVTIKSR